MKQILCMMCALACMSITAQGQGLSTIKLLQPNKTAGKSLMNALSDRKSTREFSPGKLTDQELGNLLWAAWGINREDGRRTAPSALNKQDIDLYVLMEEGAYIYDAKEHALKPVAEGDHRHAIAGGQEFAKEAPVCFVLVSELTRFGATITEHTKLMAAVNAGVISQNINLFCAANGLATVTRAYMEIDDLKTILKLTDTQLPIVNNPVGYPNL